MGMAVRPLQQTNVAGAVHGSVAGSESGAAGTGEASGYFPDRASHAVCSHRPLVFRRAPGTGKRALPRAVGHGGSGGRYGPMGPLVCVERSHRAPPFVVVAGADNGSAGPVGGPLPYLGRGTRYWLLVVMGAARPRVKERKRATSVGLGPNGVP